ncbi:hypothetical protein AMECASPLE_022044 [Ameca splendens]|uniref:Uncharacterized protein n=1 Tax=Ameca splendens TaxID=208324 RepID=A0ABV0ZCX9_9TELE
MLSLDPTNVRRRKDRAAALLLVRNGTGLQTQRLIRRSLYFEHSAVRFLSSFSILHKMPGFHPSYTVHFRPGCSSGRAPDLQSLKYASSVQ